MFIALTTIIISFCFTALVIVPFINLLYRLNFFKKKKAVITKQKNIAVSHVRSKVKTPEGAGLLLILVLIFLFPLLLTVFNDMNKVVTSNFPLEKEIAVIFFTLVSFGLLGLYDDVIKFFELQRDRGFSGLKTSTKFVLQIVLATVIAAYMYFSLGIDFLYLPFLGTICLGPYFMIFAALTIIVFTNAVNFTDGVDGLSMGILLFCLFGYLIVSVHIIDTPLSIFIGVWLGGIVAFLYFNINPANVFLGDIGSLSFGATLAVVALLSGRVFVIFVFGFLFFVEFLSSFVQLSSKAILKKPILPIAPIHYYFLKKRWPEGQLTQRAWLVTIVLVIIGLFLSVI